MERLEKKLAKRAGRHLLRSLPPTLPHIDFASNDVLGLSRSQRMIAHVESEMRQLRKRSPLTGFCATGSRLFSGNHEYAMQLEETIAPFHGHDAALILNSGYSANLALLPAVTEEDDWILFDTHIHASTREALRASIASSFPFRHNDLNSLEWRLKTSGKRAVFVCIESIYSTTGEKAPLTAIAHLCARFGAHLIVDETHAIGAYGPKGAGLVAEQCLQSYVFACTASFAKALGAFGAVVLTSPLLKKTLLNFARPFIYSSALPLQNLAAIHGSYSLFPSMYEERDRVRKLSASLEANSHIHAHTLQCPKAVDALVRELQRKDICVAPLKSPTVRKKKSGIRITVHAYNTKEEIQALKEALCAFA